MNKKIIKLLGIGTLTLGAVGTIAIPAGIVLNSNLNSRISIELNELNLNLENIFYNGTDILKTNSISDYLLETSYELKKPLLTKDNKKISLSVSKIETPGNLDKIELTYFLEIKDQSLKSENKKLLIENFAVKEAFIIDPKLQMDKRSRVLEIENLSRTQITNQNQNYLSEYKTPILTGGYGENRNIYAGSKIRTHHQFHLGEDVFLNQGTEVLAPFDGEIISYYYLPNNSIAEGIGTNLVMKVYKKDYTLGEESWNNIFGENSEFFYIAIIHLDHRFMKTKFGENRVKSIWNRSRHVIGVPTISAKTPQKVKRGEVIGLVGNIGNNGGWIPHLHVEIQKSTTPNNGMHNAIDRNGNLIKDAEGIIKTERTSGITDARIEKYIPEFINGKWQADVFDAKATGVHIVPINRDPNRDPIWILSENRFQVVDPSKIFNFRKFASKNIPVRIGD
ncbi:peptidoglycan DD-metalloendopeptidase family protein [[Mycoplasma] mobile]|nr:peptidoglycan DD-metalloendopeptidase family protein [[Mycoplasma] mobile]